MCLLSVRTGFLTRTRVSTLKTANFCEYNTQIGMVTLHLVLGVQMARSRGSPLLPQSQLNSIIKRNQETEVALIPVHDLAPALVPAPACPATGIMPPRGGGTDAGADHVPHIVPGRLGGLVRALTHRRMNAEPPDVTDHVQGVRTDSRHHHVEATVARHQGGVTGDHRLRGGAVRRGGH